MKEEQLLELFKSKAEVRTVDTRNKEGYSGYKGYIFSLKNLKLFQITNFYRFGPPKAELKYLLGSTRTSREDFIAKLDKLLKRQND